MLGGLSTEICGVFDVQGLLDSQTLGKATSNQDRPCVCMCVCVWVFICSSWGLSKAPEKQRLQSVSHVVDFEST